MNLHKYYLSEINILFQKFWIIIVLFSFVGTGKSKKIAKRLAANKMWMRLKDLPFENNSLHLGLDDEDEVRTLLSVSEF